MNFRTRQHKKCHDNVCLQNRQLIFEDFLKHSYTSLTFVVEDSFGVLRVLLLMLLLQGAWCWLNSLEKLLFVRFSQCLFTCAFSHLMSFPFIWMGANNLGVFDNCNQHPACRGGWTQCSLGVPSNLLNSVNLWLIFDKQYVESVEMETEKSCSMNLEIFCYFLNVFCMHILIMDGILCNFCEMVLCSRFMYYRFKQKDACIAPVRVVLQHFLMVMICTSSIH